MKKALGLAVLLVINGFLHAQSYLSFGFHGALPQSGLKASGYDKGWGAHFSWMSRTLKVADIDGWQLGLFSDISAMQHKTFGVMLNTPVPDNGKLTVNNSTMSFYGVVRKAWAQQKRSTFYSDFVFGPRGYYTNQVITAENPNLNPGYESTTNYPEVVVTGKMQTGIGAGVLYQLRPSIFADFGFTYAMGPEGLIQPLKDITQHGNEIRYNPNMINTNILLIRGTLTFKLRKSQNTNTPTYPTGQQPEQQIYRRSTAPSVRPEKSSPPAPKKPLEVKPNTPTKNSNN